MPNVVDRLGGASSSLAFKAPCRLATTANLTSLSGFQSVDGVLPTSSEHVDLRRILVKNQTDASANGIYTMDTGTWERTKDFDGVNDFRQGTRVFVWGGSTQSGSYLVDSSMDPSTFDFDTDDITFALASSVDVTNLEFADGEGIYDDSSNEQLIFQKSSTGAVNYFEMTNSTAGSAPSLAVNGDDTNIDFRIESKGSGNIVFKSDGGTINQFVIGRTASAVNYLQAQPASSGSGPTLFAVGTDTNVNLNLTAQATGIVKSTSYVQFDAAVTSSSITANGALTSTAITASGLITGSAGVSVSSTFTSSGNINAVSGTTITAGGVTGKGIMLFGSTTFGIYAGSGAPTIAAGQGSFYMRTDGASSLSRAYIQTSGSTNTWVGLLTTA
jgi:hypothetical protein